MNIKIISIFLNLLIINFLAISYKDHFYKRKYGNTYIYFTVILFNTMITGLNEIFGNPLICIIYMAISLFIISFLLYHSEPKIMLFYDVSIAIIVVLSDLFLDSLTGILYHISIPEVMSNKNYYPQRDAIALILYLLFYLILIKYMKKSPLQLSMKRNSVLTNAFIIVQLIFVFFLLYSQIVQKSANVMSTLIAINIFIMILIQIKYLNKSAQYSELEEKYNIQKLQSDLLFDNYNELIKENDEKEKLIHDIQNHLNTLSELTENKVSPMSYNYSRKIKQSLKNPDWRYHFHNEVLEAILNSKRRICQYHQMKLILKIREDGLSVIEPYDLTTILGNLLDNAIEGCFNHPDKRIEVRIYSIENFLNIYIKNTYTDEIKQNRWGKLESNKPGHKGIGIQNVNEVINKYDGFMKYDINEQEFIIKITIPMQTI